MSEVSEKKIVATIEARMSSTRLPGKVLMPLANKPALERLIDRLKHSKYLDEIIIATTTNPRDDAIVQLAKKIGVKYYRGSEEDVLQRVLDTARSVSADIIVEITGDCPLIDYRLVDRSIEEFFSHQVDYVGHEGHPVGFGVDVFPVSILDQVEKKTKNPIDRTHVSYYIYTHPDEFRVHFWPATEKLNLPNWRLTLDEKKDYELINIIFNELLPVGDDFSLEQIVDFLQSRPELLKINEDVKQKSPQEG